MINERPGPCVKIPQKDLLFSTETFMPSVQTISLITMIKT